MNISFLPSLRWALCGVIIILHSSFFILHSQTFALRPAGDSLSVLTLLSAQGDTSDIWLHPYRTWKLISADLNADGIDEALLGVVKPTRFDSVSARRLFIFKNVRGRVRPLWLGSALGGGRLIDFRLSAQKIIAIEEYAPSLYNVSVYALARFGLSFVEYVAKGVGEKEARAAFSYAAPAK